MKSKGQRDQTRGGGVFRSLIVIVSWGVVGGLIPMGCVGCLAMNDLRQGFDLPRGDDVNSLLGCFMVGSLLFGGSIGCIVGVILAARKGFYRTQRFNWED